MIRARKSDNWTIETYDDGKYVLKCVNKKIHPKTCYLSWDNWISGELSHARVMEKTEAESVLVKIKSDVS